jgi:hypothetical protein
MADGEIAEAQRAIPCTATILFPVASEGIEPCNYAFEMHNYS